MIRRRMQPASFSWFTKCLLSALKSSVCRQSGKIYTIDEKEMRDAVINKLLGKMVFFLAHLEKTP